MIALQMAFRDKHPVTHLVFSPDQCTVAVAQPHCGVTLLERGTGRTRAVCATPKRGVLTGLAFTGDGRLLVAASSKGLSVFNAGSGAWIANSAPIPNSGLKLGASPGGVISVGPGGLVREWTADELANKRFYLRGPHGPAPGTALAFCPAGRGLVVQRHGRAELFDLVAGRVTAKFGCPEPEPNAPPQIAKFCSLGRRIALNDGRTLDVYDSANPADEDEPRTDLPLVPPACTTSPGGAVAVGPMPRVVLSPVFTLAPEPAGTGRGWYPPFALLPDGRGLLVKRPRNRVQLWDAPAGALVTEWSWQFEWLTCLAVSADGLTAVAGGRFGRVLLWDLD